MELITRKEMENLAGQHSAFCISVFIPTHRGGEAVLQHEDALVLKNQLTDVKRKLSEEGLSAGEINELIRPIDELVHNSSFWRHQEEGLALFLTDGFWRSYVLPLRFEAFNYVSNAFYLKPLMPLFENDERYFLLTLALDNAKLYRGNRLGVEQVPLDKVVPSRPEEVVGYDYEQINTMARSVKGDGVSAAFNGYGEGKDDRKEETERFFRAIDKGLMTYLHNEKLPMVVACLDYQFPMYKKVNTYLHLHPEFVSGHPGDMDASQLHERSWNLLHPLFYRERGEKIALCQQYQETARTAFDIGSILPAVLDGKVEALFLQNGVEIWGVYDPSDRTVQLEEVQKPYNVSLVNLAAIRTFFQGGKVYLMEEGEMPLPGEPVTALFRY